MVSSEDGKGGSIWIWAKANTQNTQHTHTHTQAKSLCDHSNEAESAEHLAKPQQHFTIASLQLCACVRTSWNRMCVSLPQPAVTKFLK